MNDMEYALGRKMEITGISRSLVFHKGETAEFHIKYCVPLLLKEMNK